MMKVRTVYIWNSMNVRTTKYFYNIIINKSHHRSYFITNYLSSSSTDVPARWSGGNKITRVMRGHFSANQNTNNHKELTKLNTFS